MNGTTQWDYTQLKHVNYAKAKYSCGVQSTSSSSSSQSSSYFNETKAKSYFNSLRSYQRKAIQQVLVADGLYTSTVDGIWGRKTSAALKEVFRQTKISPESEMIRRILRIANEQGVTDAIMDAEARYREQQQSIAIQKEYKAKIQKERNAQFQACYGFCIAKYGFQRMGACAAHCGNR